MQRAERVEWPKGAWTNGGFVQQVVFAEGKGFPQG